MEIEEVNGDILEFPNDIDIIMHGCNTLNVFGSGIAKQIREKYPEVYEADKDFFKAGHAVLGNFSGARLKDKTDKYIFNLYQQSSYGKDSKRYMSYDALCEALEKVKKLIKKQEKDYVLGFPMIGCGTAGGNWEVVKPMITSTFSDCKNIKKIVFVYYDK